MAKLASPAGADAAGGVAEVPSVARVAAASSRGVSVEEVAGVVDASEGLEASDGGAAAAVDDVDDEAAGADASGLAAFGCAGARVLSVNGRLGCRLVARSSDSPLQPSEPRSPFL